MNRHLMVASRCLRLVLTWARNRRGRCIVAESAGIGLDIPRQTHWLVTALSIGGPDSVEIWEIDARHAWIAY